MTGNYNTAKQEISHIHIFSNLVGGTIFSPFVILSFRHSDLEKYAD